MRPFRRRRRGPLVQLELDHDQIEILPAPPAGIEQSHYARVVRWYSWHNEELGFPDFHVVLYTPAAGHQWHASVHFDDESVVFAVRDQTGELDGYGEHHADAVAIEAAHIIQAGGYDTRPVYARTAPIRRKHETTLPDNFDIEDFYQ